MPMEISKVFSSLSCQARYRRTFYPITINTGRNFSNAPTFSFMCQFFSWIPACTGMIKAAKQKQKLRENIKKDDLLLSSQKNFNG
jgi:hypothetical protein